MSRQRQEYEIAIYLSYCSTFCKNLSGRLYRLDMFSKDSKHFRQVIFFCVQRYKILQYYWQAIIGGKSPDLMRYSFAIANRADSFEWQVMSCLMFVNLLKIDSQQKVLSSFGPQVYTQIMNILIINILIHNCHHLTQLFSKTSSNSYFQEIQLFHKCTKDTYQIILIMSTNPEPQAELLDLPQQDEKPKVSFCSPKLVVLSLFSAYFLAQNIYTYITNPPLPPTQPLPEVDQWANFWALYDRFQSYIVLSVVGFALLVFLRRSNERAEEEKYLAQKKIQEEKEQSQRKLQAQREERIIRKLQEEERAAAEKQLRAAQAFSYPKEAHTKSE